MPSDLSKAARQHAKQVEELRNADKAEAVIRAQEQAKRDLPEWEKRIRDQLAKQRAVPFLKVNSSSAERLKSSFWGTVCRIETIDFFDHTFHISYVAELQKLLGEGFSVFGGCDYGHQPFSFLRLFLFPLPCRA